MKIVSLVQGSPEWHAHRAAHFNASDAPAMMCVSPYKTRGDLIREYATGITAEIDASTQRIFDAGHRYEELARVKAENELIGEELYPCVGTDGRFSASFDGITMDVITIFEHKSLNNRIRAAFENSGDETLLPEDYRIQMEHQLLVSGADIALFVASQWDGEEPTGWVHAYYSPDMELRKRIVAGWAQFEKDVAAYVPSATEVVAVGRAPDSLPALRIELSGGVTASNLADFRDHAVGVFRGINTDLQTDQDFADADKTVKWCGDIEDRLRAAKDHALSQTRSIDELFRAIDAISAEARAKRLELEKLVKGRKDSLRAEILAAGAKAIADHYNKMADSLGKYAVFTPNYVAIMAAAIKGKRSFGAMRDAVNDAVATAKIEANEHADRIRACVAVVDEHAKEHESLFPDRISLCHSKGPEDLRNLIASRIAEHEKREAGRIERELQESRAQTKPAWSEEALDLLNANRRPAELASADALPKRAVSALLTRQCGRPTDAKIIEVIGLHFSATKRTVIGWLHDIDLEAESQNIGAA